MAGLSGQCSITTSFQGTVVSIDSAAIAVETGVGVVQLRVNAGTRVFNERATPPRAIRNADLGQRLDGDRVLGQRVIGMLVAPGHGAAPRLERAICTELHLFGQDPLGLPYMDPEFWTRNLSDLASWWLERSGDEQCGGYYTNLSDHGCIRADATDTDKWPYVVSRTLYGLSTAFALTGRRAFLEGARSGVRFLLTSGLFDRQGYALFHTRLDRYGRRHQEDPDLLNIFTQLYALTGLVAYYDATRCPGVANAVDTSLRSLAELYHDERSQGFYDAIESTTLKPIDGVTDSKSFNSIVDPLSAALFFLKNCGFRSQYLDIGRTIHELLTLVMRHFAVANETFIREVLSRTWEHRPPLWHNPYNTPFDRASVGGNMKTAWVLLRGLGFLAPEEREGAVERAGQVHAHMHRCGAYDALRGGWFGMMRRATPPGALAEHMGCTSKVWWQQEEGILACLLMYLVSGDAVFSEMASGGMAFWVSYFLDREHGGVHDTVSADGLPIIRRKGSWLKGGYHEIELARYAHVYLSVIRKQPVALFYESDSAEQASRYYSIPAQIPGVRWRVLDARIVDEGVLRVRYETGWNT